MTTRETALLVTLGLLAVYSANARATGNGPQETRVNVYANQQTTVATVARATAVAGASATGGNAQAGGGTASATGGAGGVANVTVNSGGRRTTELRTVGVAPDMIASPTAPCRIAMGIGGGPMGWAASIFGSTLDEGCDAREDARLLHNLGRQDAAIARLCAKPEMAKALGCEVEAPAVEVGAH